MVNGALGRNRTDDLLITSEPLCQLSYKGLMLQFWDPRDKRLGVDLDSPVEPRPPETPPTGLGPSGVLYCEVLWVEPCTHQEG